MGTILVNYEERKFVSSCFLVVDVRRNDSHLLIGIEHVIKVFTIANRVAEFGV